MPKRRILYSVAAAMGIVVLLFVALVLVFTQTDWGRERVRLLVLRQLNEAAEGEVDVGRIQGNLLRRIELVDVAIVDEQGRPFLQADTLGARFSLRSLIRRRIVLTDVRMVNGIVVLDQPPGEDWNWVRIFPTDPAAVVEPRRPGFGDWIELRDVSIVDGQVMVRTEWEAPEDLTPEEAEAALRVALSPEARENLQQVPGGFQNVMEFRQINARFPLIRPSHPDSVAIPIRVASFSGIAQPFKPPAAEIQDLSGEFRLAQDSLFFTGVQAVLPGSRLSAEGVYALDAGDLVLHMNASPFAFPDFRFLYPPLPEEGGGSLRMSLNMRTLATRVVTEDMDLRVGASRLTGRMDLTMGDTLRLQDTNLRFASLDTRLIERMAPELEIPRHGVLDGHLILNGTVDAMNMDADIAFQDDVAGRSRVLAVGEIGFGDQVRFGDFRLQLDPLQAELVRTFAPDLPLRGTITGYANLTGPFGGPLQVDSDLLLRDPEAGVSRVVAVGGLDMRDELRLQNMLIRVDPLRMALVRRAVPDLQVGGTLTGQVRLDGVVSRALSVDGGLTLQDPATGTSRVSATGGVAYADELAFQNLLVRVDPLQLELARGWVPDLPAGATLSGRALLNGAPSRRVAVDADLALTDPATGISRITAEGGVNTAGDDLQLQNMALRVDPLQLDLLRPWVPDLPAGMTLQGRALLDGQPTGRIAVDADLALTDPASGVSRITAEGGVDTSGDLQLQNMALRVDPLRLDLLRPWVPDLPQGMTLQGRALLDGNAARQIALDADLTVTDPATGVSRLVAEGGVRTAGELELVNLSLIADPVQLNLVRPWVPDLPRNAVLEGRAFLNGVPQRRLQVNADLSVREPVSGLSRVTAVGGIRTADELAFDGMQLRFLPLRTDLVRGFAPELPRGGMLTGDLLLDGAPERLLQIEAQLAHESPGLGLSRVFASGGIITADQLAFRGMDLRFDPLRMELVRAFSPGFPVGGTLQGNARLDGSPEGRLAFGLDLTHREGGEFSQVSGTGEVVSGAQGFANVDLQLQPLSLEVVGRFAPGAGLHGSVAGSLQASGPMSDLALNADLQFADGSQLAASGSLDLASDEPAYDLTMRMADFDLRALSTNAPAETDLTGTAFVRGRGTDPATMRAELAADLVSSQVDDVSADEVRLRVAIDQGLATVQDSRVRIGTAEATADGSFGLVAGRHGELAFRVDVDDLSDFAGFVPAPPAEAPLPGEPADPVEPLNPTAPPALPPTRLAGGETIHLTGGLTRVRYPGSDQVYGPAEEDPVPVDITLDIPPAGAGDSSQLAVPPIPRPGDVPRDAVAGSIFAEGTVRGNVEQFDVDADARVEGLVYGGYQVGSGEASVTALNARSPLMDLQLDADLRAVRGGGIAFDSVSVNGSFAGSTEEGRGRAVVAAFQDEATDLRAEAEFALSLESSEVRLADAAIRFDETVWQTLQPGVIRWAEGNIEVDRLELISSEGGRIFVDGSLLAEGTSDMEIVITDLEIGQVVSLLQQDQNAAGRLTFVARVRGTQANPFMEGEAALVEARFDDVGLPDVRATFNYAERELVANADLVQDGRIAAVAEASLPLDLALTTDAESRLLPGPIRMELRADELALDPVSAFTDQIEVENGTFTGNINVGGTFENPVLEGEASLDIQNVGVDALGIWFADIVGLARLEGDRLVVDSLVAYSGGPITLSGEITLPSVTEPVFDLALAVREAWVIDTEDARLNVNADLSISGTLETLSVTGDVQTRRGVIYIPEAADLGGGELVNLDDPGTFSRLDELLITERDRLLQPSPLLENLQMDIGVLIERDLWVRSTEANIEIYTPADIGPLRVRMTGGPATLALEGAINTDRGEYEFMSRRFRLTRGAVVFAGESEFNPFIQLAAEHEVQVPGREAFSIRVVIDGTIEDLTVALESTAQPPISQTDLLSYLAFGREAASLLQQQGSSLGGAGGGATGNIVGNVAGMATQQLAAVALDALVSGLERDAARNLGLDVIRITPANLPAEVFTGSYMDFLRGTEVEAGRYLTGRLFVAGQARPTFVQPGARVEYRTPFGFIWNTTWQPRFLASEPTLQQTEPLRTSVFGSFLSREWRF